MDADRYAEVLGLLLGELVSFTPSAAVQPGPFSSRYLGSVCTPIGYWSSWEQFDLRDGLGSRSC